MFSNPWIGRPVRKILYLIHEMLCIVNWLIQELLSKMPFVKVEGIRNHFKDNFDAILKYYRALESRVNDLPYKPLISVLVPVYKVNPRYLREALQSIAIQCYPNWEVCLVDDGSNDPSIAGLLREFHARFPDRVKFKINLNNQHIAIASNECLALAQGDYVALLDHDDRLYPNALAEMVRYINWHDRPEILYSDERTIDADGNPAGLPVYKPGYSPYYLLSANYTTHLSLYSRPLLNAIGGFRKGYEGSQDHDLMLRASEQTPKPIVHVPFCLYQWRAHSDSTAAAVEAKPYVVNAGRKAIKDALVRRGISADVEWEPDTFHYRIKWHIPTPSPLVSIIIPSKDAHSFISTCIGSIFEKSTYVNFEIIVVDNGSTDPLVEKFYQNTAEKRGSKFRVVHAPGAFNFARLINTGVDAAKGDYFLFLNNDTEVISPNWIEEMLGIAIQEGVGAVGCKLLYPSDKIQHAGISFLGENIAVNMGVTCNADDDLYFNYLNTTHEVGAVSAACLTIKRETYFQAGKLEELWVPNGWGDVKFGIDLQEAGFRNVYTPYARLRHFESPSRGASIEFFERFYLMTNHSKYLLNDPYLNPNLSRGPIFKVNPDYLNFELFEPMFRYLLETSPKEWNRTSFECYLAANKIPPNYLVRFLK